MGKLSQADLVRAMRNDRVGELIEVISSAA